MGKKGYIGSLIMLMLTATSLSCKKDRRTEFFQLHYFVDFEIMPGLNTFDTHFYVISPLASQLQTKLAAAGRDESEIVAIEPRRASLASVFEDVNLDFIHRVSIYVFDPFNPSDKIEFLYLDPVPFKDKTVIQLFPGIADIRDWIERDYLGIEVRLNYREVTPSLTQMRLEFDLRVLGE